MILYQMLYLNVLWEVCGIFVLLCASTGNVRKGKTCLDTGEYVIEQLFKIDFCVFGQIF